MEGRVGENLGEGEGTVGFEETVGEVGEFWEEGFWGKSGDENVRCEVYVPAMTERVGGRAELSEVLVKFWMNGIIINTERNLIPSQGRVRELTRSQRSFLIPRNSSLATIAQTHSGTTVPSFNVKSNSTSSPTL